MRKRLFITGLFFFALTLLVSAQDKASAARSQIPSRPVRGVFVDENKNGICDNQEIYGRFFGNGRMRGNLTPARGWRGTGLRQENASGRGQGRGLGPGMGIGAAPGGRYFTDDNKNGVCDNFESKNKEK